MAKSNGGEKPPAAKGEVVSEQGLAVQLAEARKENEALKAAMAKEQAGPVARIVFTAPYVKPGGEEEDSKKQTKTQAIATASITGLILGHPNLIIGDIRLAVYRDNPKKIVVFMPAAGASYSSRRHIAPKRTLRTYYDDQHNPVKEEEGDDPEGAKELAALQQSIVDAWMAFGKTPKEERWGKEREL